MVSTAEAIQPENIQRRGTAAVKEGGRIIATTFLSLLLPLSFLLLARLSVARYFLSSNIIIDHETSSSFLRSVFTHCKTTIILSFIVDVVAIEALLHGISGHKPAFVLCERRRICVAWVLIFLVQFCLILGIHGTVDAEINFTVGNLVSPRRIVFVLGLHEIMLFWRRSVVAPVVDETMAESIENGISWVEEVVLAAAFGNLWWRRLRDETEALVALPWVRTELKKNLEVEVADAIGWLLYYLTAAVGGVRVIKGFVWVAARISGQRHWPKKKGVDAAVNSPV